MRNKIRKNLKVLSRIPKLTLTNTYLIMEQIIRILLLQVVTNVYPAGFWCVICTAPRQSTTINAEIVYTVLRPKPALLISTTTRITCLGHNQYHWFRSQPVILVKASHAICAGTILTPDIEIDLGLFNNILDGDVWIVSLDGKLVLGCYSVRKQHQRPLKQVLTRGV